MVATTNQYEKETMKHTLGVVTIRVLMAINHTYTAEKLKISPFLT